MAGTPDYYKTLGVPRDASADEIKKAFRKLAREHHPDAGGSEEKFKEINEAYEVLSDEKKRQVYDQFGSAGGKMPGWGGQGGAGFSGSWSDILESIRRGEGAFGTNWNISDIASMFSNMGNMGNMGGMGGARAQYTQGYPGGFGGAGFGQQAAGGCGGGGCGGGGCGGGGCGGPQPGRDVNVTLSVSFDDAFNGCEKRVTLRVPGASESQTLDVKIPAGMKDGGKLRKRGKGAPSTSGGKNGDLMITVNIEPHEYFSRDGADVVVNTPVSFAEAALGASVVVPAPDGSRVRVKVPAGTQSGTILTIKGKGAPLLKGEGFGNLKIKLDVQVPTQLNDAQKKALEDFQAATEEDVRSWQ